MNTKYISHTSATPPSLLRKAAAVIATAALAGLVVMFSAVLLAAVLLIGAMASAYLWWKTRELRKRMRNFPPRGAAMEGAAFRDEGGGAEVIRGEVIEGEVIHVDEAGNKIRR